MRRKNLLLILICASLVCLSLFLGSRNGDFEGADSIVQEQIVEIDENYKPWFSSILKPPSGEIESLLFSLQAAIGGGFVGFYIGRKRNVQNSNSLCKK